MDKIRYKDEILRRMPKLPLYAQKVLMCNGGFLSYDVVYDDERQLEYLQDRADKLGVTLNRGKGLSLNNDTETCTGPIYACIMYMNDMLTADDGYVGAMCFHIDDLSNITDNEFGDFCIWMNKWLPDWLEGMKYNDELKHKANIIYGLEENKTA